ncbi:MAG: AAA family ATPase [bacterium]
MATIVFRKGPLVGQQHEVPEAGINIGRSPTCKLPISDGKVSGEHMQLRMEAGAWWVYDLQSTNGTFVNGRQIQAIRLNEGDQIAVGESIIIFHLGKVPVVDPNAIPDKPAAAEITRPDGEIKIVSRAARENQLSKDDLQAAAALTDAYRRMREQIARTIVGQQDVVEQVLIAIFCRGHALLDGVPGVAKTLLVSTLGHLLDLSYKRIQFTPDLMPSDITGSDVLQEDQTTGKRVFRFIQGPIFANMLLADEINRTPPKTQAALLEAMQEHRVTIGDTSYHLPEPFFVLATQNPIEQEGTYPLPEAQLDRFMFNIIVDYPKADEEAEIIKQVTGVYKAELEVTLTAQEVLNLQQIVRRVPVASHVIDYARDIARATRPKAPDAPDFVKEMVSWGAGPRAGICLITAAKARAILHGRYHATTEDVRQVALPVMRHRVLTTFNAEAAGVTSDDIVRMVIDRLKPVEDINV